MYISAGAASNSGGPTLTQGTVTATHTMYQIGNTPTSYYVAAGPFSCSSAGALSATSYSTIKSVGSAPVMGSGAPTGSPEIGGFGDIGFLPKGTLFFYYLVNSDTTANTTAPTTAAIPTLTTITDGGCGAGYEAEAWTNFAGNNIQGYGINDYTSSSNLIYGTAF